MGVVILNFEIITLNNSNFVINLEKIINKKVIKFDSDIFADSEICIKWQNLSFIKKQIFIIHQFSFETKSINDQIIELLLLSDLAKKMGAEKVFVILPYYPYSRHDKSFDKKLNGPVFLFDKLFKACGIDEIITFELHNSLVKNNFSVKTQEVNLINFGVDFFNKNKNIVLDDFKTCFLSPDQGRAESIKQIAQFAGVDFAYVKKERIRKDFAVSRELIGDVKNKNVIIIDDIIDTGNTAIGACEIAMNNGAKQVLGFFAHAVLSKDCIKKLNDSKFKHIFITDTVLTKDKLSLTDKVTQTTLANELGDFFKKNYFNY